MSDVFQLLRERRLTKEAIAGITSCEDCGRLLTDINDALAAVKRQIEDACAKNNTSAEQSDWAWLNRARDAQRRLGILAQATQLRLGELNREAKALQRRTLGPKDPQIEKRGEQFAAEIFADGERAGAWAERERVVAALLRWSDGSALPDARLVRSLALRIEEEEHLVSHT